MRLMTVHALDDDDGLMRARPFVGMRIALILVGLLIATGACDLQGDCSCLGPMLLIQSPANDLVVAEGCGSVVACQGSASCSELVVRPPADGGVCVTTITFADQTTTTITTNWGGPHPAPCCGPTFDFNGGVVTVHGDAGAPDSD